MGTRRCVPPTPYPPPCTLDQDKHSRLLPPLVVHIVVRTHNARLGRRLVPIIDLQYFGFVDEWTVVAQHTLVHDECLCGHECRRVEFKLWRVSGDFAERSASERQIQQARTAYGDERG